MFHCVIHFPFFSTARGSVLTKWMQNDTFTVGRARQKNRKRNILTTERKKNYEMNQNRLEISLKCNTPISRSSYSWSFMHIARTSIHMYILDVSVVFYERDNFVLSVFFFLLNTATLRKEIVFKLFSFTWFYKLIIFLKRQLHFDILYFDTEYFVF